MTSTDPGTIDAANPPGAPDQSDQPDPASEPNSSTDDKPGSEAAKWRRRLRDTEVERDTLAQRVERFQRAEVTRLVADDLAQPGDLFRFGVTLADVLDDDGKVEPGLVATALSGLLEARPGLGKPAPQQRGPSSHGQGHRPVAVDASPSWADVIRKR